jgi:hypothetical protein
VHREQRHAANEAGRFGDYGGHKCHADYLSDTDHDHTAPAA